jgi:hypothetical protein
MLKSLSLSYFATDSQSVSLSWHLALPRFYMLIDNYRMMSWGIFPKGKRKIITRNQIFCMGVPSCMNYVQ